MKDLICHKDSIEIRFAEAVLASMKQKRYGIATCGVVQDITEYSVLKQILDYQLVRRHSQCGVDINAETNFPVLNNGLPMLPGSSSRTCSNEVTVTTPSGQQDIVQITTANGITNVNISSVAGGRLQTIVVRGSQLTLGSYLSNPAYEFVDTSLAGLFFDVEYKGIGTLIPTEEWVPISTGGFYLLIPGYVPQPNDTFFIKF